MGGEMMIMAGGIYPTKYHFRGGLIDLYTIYIKYLDEYPS